MTALEAHKLQQEYVKNNSDTLEQVLNKIESVARDGGTYIRVKKLTEFTMIKLRQLQYEVNEEKNDVGMFESVMIKISW